MKVWHISDTHGNHEQLNVPKGVDLVIHSGDATNYRDPSLNEVEMRDFLAWYSALDIEYKVYVGGNHDTSLEVKFVTAEEIQGNGIMYLFQNEVTIDGIKLWGSPFTPVFHHWAFNMSRDKLRENWNNIPKDTDVVITHGPPRGILDQCMGDYGKENAGCIYLDKRIEYIEPKYHMFGHIHDNHGLRNQGVFMRGGITYSNASAVTDGKIGRLSSHGNVFNIGKSTDN